MNTKQKNFSQQLRQKCYYKDKFMLLDVCFYDKKDKNKYYGW